MTQVMRKTLLAPDIVERIGEGRIAPDLAELLELFPVK